MKKIISSICLILMLIVPTCVKATSENELLQMQEETNQIIKSIESQRLDGNASNSFVYAIFIVVAVSMIFENFIRGYKEEIRKKKEVEEPVKAIRLKLLLAYGIHLLLIGILWLICTYALRITGIYIWFLIVITVYIVEISPLFTINFRKKKKE